MDTAFFGREFGILVLMDSNSNNVISHYFVLTEKDIYYKLTLNRLREKGYFPYKHCNVISAYAGLKRYMDFIFTYEKYSELNIENTTNRLEGLFSELKRKLNNHNGLTKKRKMLFIQGFLNKKSC